MRYPTKVDGWLVVVLGIAAILPVVIAVAGWRAEGLGSPTAWLAIGIVAMSALCVGVMALPTYYEVGPDRLTIRSGILRWDVPLSSIESVVRTRNPMGSPAWSLDRLEVRWVRAGTVQSIMISPLDREAFLRELATREPALSLRGYELWRSERHSVAAETQSRPR
jgi:membrane protein YdbS with pleckstrin-like domain